MSAHVKYWHGRLQTDGVNAALFIALPFRRHWSFFHYVNSGITFMMEMNEGRSNECLNNTKAVQFSAACSAF